MLSSSIVLILLSLGIILISFLCLHRSQRSTNDNVQTSFQMLHTGPIKISQEQFHLTNNDQPFVRPRDSNDNRVNTWSRSWRLPQPDNGTFLFTIDSNLTGTGLVIGLQTTQVDEATWATSGGGYAIVYNGDVNKPASWIGKLPYFDKQMPGSRQNFGDQFEPGQYWVSVRYGLIMIGHGSEPGQNIIVMAHDPNPVQNIQYIGFGIFTRATGQPVLQNACVSVSDLQIITRPLTNLILPNCSVDCNGQFQWANVHQMTKERLNSVGLTSA